MSLENFQVVEVNPNDVVGSGGCLCSETKVEDACGPYVVFSAVETDSPISPHAVLCAGCTRAAALAIEGEVLAGGERGEVTIDGEAEEVPEV